ncbi:DUF1697 domain-containing protein [Aurantibacter crassamenti]|uniref:DUF1697 domain-containing protein n=1 Tax=Aurantibacter crassamenti TaxID=1837375 RepID=UPI0019394903|nr:DUF1697 domain-containing protein [Aurantibacter crassamenti]MBM1104745.1 DUF1697 domain-containing protein [Aurantibacter crassamenti]
MQTYVVLLRGINVSGQKKIIMADLRKMLEQSNFQEVETYIQSGNIVLKSNEKDNVKVASKIKSAIAETFGFDIFVLAKKYDELKDIFDANPFTDPIDIENKKVYFALLENSPQSEIVAEFNKIEFVNEQFSIKNNCVYLNYTNGAGKAKLTNNLIERKLKVAATSRNYRTMVKLLEMSAKTSH